MTTPVTSSGGSNPLPLHQVLYFAIISDSAGQYTVLLPAGQTACSSKVSGDGTFEVAKLGVGVQVHVHATIEARGDWAG